ncbi:uncharacterized protein LOC113298013 [Papaver somniferum]|uniref:uncharacterized protein LOC113298013 n=1 Tax=Papaver somniferum TaxID=3469 RepID=UPI000E6F90ED|nr:uncharacterized protein LOC113298013 [Papaver somniferum]
MEQKQKDMSGVLGRDGEKKEMDAEEKVLEELPLESSPYVKYSDIEDYKRQGYGTEGHLQPKTGLGAGATDAPTPSGTALSGKQEERASKGAEVHA